MENLSYALSKKQRFLDTTLKISELETKEEIYDSEINNRVNNEHNTLGEGDENFPIKTIFEGTRGDYEMEMSDCDSPRAMYKQEAKLTQSKNKQKSLNMLLNMDTDDFKFYQVEQLPDGDRRAS
jgi:hypothetical protein